MPMAMLHAYVANESHDGLALAGDDCVQWQRQEDQVRASDSTSWARTRSQVCANKPSTSGQVSHRVARRKRERGIALIAYQ